MHDMPDEQFPDANGFKYIPSFVSEPEEQAALELFATMPFRSIRMRGQIARRKVCCFGFDYLYTRRGVVPAEPMPPVLMRLRERVEALTAESSEFNQAIVTSYPPGAGINWHHDAPVFGPTIVGVSFGSAARLLLKLGDVVHRVALAPRSAYVLGGAARSEWSHRVAPVASHRYSVTFRQLPTA